MQNLHNALLLKQLYQLKQLGYRNTDILRDINTVICKSTHFSIGYDIIRINSTSKKAY